MKRMAVLWLLFLALVILVFPSFADVQEEAYETIQHLYEEAEKKETEFNDLDGAIEELNKLKSFYEAEINSDQNFMEFNLSALYYDYAIARIELQTENPDYRKAEELLQKSKDSLYLGNAYYLFARGMREMEDQLFSFSYQHLSEIGTALPKYYQRIQTAIVDNQTCYRNSVKQQGIDECSKGNHERAQELYNAYLELFPSDAEIRSLLNSCADTHGETPVSNVVPGRIFEISGRVNETQIELDLTDSEKGHQYIVTLNPDNGGELSSKSARENSSIIFEDLIPGTIYIAKVTDDESPPASANCEIETPSAKRMLRNDLDYRGTIVCCVEKGFLTKKPLQDLFLGFPELFSEIENYSVTMAQMDRSTLCAISSFYCPSSQILLHIRCVLRTASSGVWQGENQEWLGKPDESGILHIPTDLSPLLNQILIDLGKLPEDDYLFEIYIDGEICGTYSFAIKAKNKI